ncbi:MAG: TolC family protein [Bryobacteraceae bacterium]
MRFRVTLTLLLCAFSAPGQNAVVNPDKASPATIEKMQFAEAAPTFPSANYFRTIMRKTTPNIELKPPVHLSDYVADSKLEISLRSYLDAVMANNTDISVQKLSVEVFRNNILRAFSVFDPLVTARFNATRTETPANDVLAGASALNSLSQPTNFQWTQILSSGAQYNVGFSTLKSSTNSTFQLFNPAISANFNASFSQPLLRNRGSYLTKLPITIARSRLRGSEYNLQNQVLQLVSNAENAYWDVVLARENVKVQEQALALADTSLKRAQRELELGAISSLDIYQPQAQFANYQIQVSQARYRLQQVEDVLRKQMGADLDPAIRRLPVVLTEPIDPPADIPMDREAIVQKAIDFRPDVKAARQNIDIDDLNIKSAVNGLKPDFRLTGQYGAAGRGGPFTQRQNVFQGDGTTGTVISTVPGGFGDALDQLFGFGFPVYGFGLTLTLPIRDRRASADYADAVVNKRLDALRVRSAEQTVRLDVLNAISLVEGSKANIELAKIALDLAQKRVDAEQKKYDLGTSTLFFLLDAQTALNQAQSALVNQSVNHRKNLTNLLRYTGELLPERGIAIQ